MPEGPELHSGPRDRSLASPAQIRATPRACWVQGPHLSSLRLPGLALSSGCPLGAFMTPFYQGTALPWPGRSRVPAPEPIQPPPSPRRGILSLQPPIFCNVTSRPPPPAGSPHNSASRAYSVGEAPSIFPRRSHMPGPTLPFPGIPPSGSLIPPRPPRASSTPHTPLRFCSPPPCGGRPKNADGATLVPPPWVVHPQHGGFPTS